jgi:hypothetical protein
VSDHLIAEANRHAKAFGKMTLPTTQSTQRDIEWYIEECIDLRKQLDRECASKREHLRIACEEINGLKVRVGIYERENANLRADKARLDWLERRTVSRLQAVLDHVELHKLPIREAIDLAIEEIGQ